MTRQKIIPILNSFPLVKEKEATKYAFTLVELIVVITILAILGTIAFISLQGYSSQSRDSVRISDMASMKTGLELFNLEAGKYPLPSDETVITYSGAVAWTQGYFGEQTTKNISKLDKIPTDPLTDKKYVYSTTNTRYEYQLAGVMEGDSIALNPSQPSLKLGKEQLQANAATKTAILKISGSYNGKVLKVSTGSTNYVLAVPSLITSSGTTLENITTNNFLAYNGYKNIPFQYSGTYVLQGETGLNLLNSSNLIVYQGDLLTLSDTTATGTLARKTLIQKLQLAYSGTTIKNVGEISTILLTDTNDANATESVSTTLVSNNLGGSITSSSSSSSSSSTSSSGGATGWMALDSNCDIPDITKGSQVWAGCNSTLGTGIEYSVDQNCHNYVGGTTTGCNRPSNEKENVFNPTYGINNIWGKFYLWADSGTACPAGRHVPTDAQWEILETTLNGGINCRNATNGELCTGLGWSGHTSKDSTNNLIEALKIPLAGYRNLDGVTFYDRGYYANLWSSTPSAGNAYIRPLFWNVSTVGRVARSQAGAYSVRCLKD